MMESPLYQTIRFCVAMCCITVVLAFNASHFDETELRAIMIIAVLGGSGEWFLRKVQDGTVAEIFRRLAKRSEGDK